MNQDTEKSDNNIDFNEIDEELEGIYRKLQKIGSFTINDSKIYITLLKVGLSSPAKISEKSQVDRARVYDSLKRLVKRGIVEEEPVQRAPRYRAFPPDIVFGQIRQNFKNQIKLADSLENQLKSIKPVSNEQNSVWSIQGEQKIRKKTHGFINEAKEFCFFILTLDNSLSSLRELEVLSNILIEKRLQIPTFKISIALNIFPEKLEQKAIINKLFHANIEIYRWEPTSILPFGLILTEQAFLQTFLSNTSPKPKYEFGIIMEKANLEQLIGFQHLCIWTYSQLCKKVIFKLKKSKKKANND